MNTTETNKARSAKELIEALATSRERARVQLHLLSLDARDAWHELESKIEALESKLESDGERLGESAAKKVRELTLAVKDLLQRHGGIAELAVPAAELMQHARACRPDDSLNEPARLMWDCDCGAVPVVDEAGMLVGIITDRDICMAAYTRGQPLSSLSVASVMAKNVAVASPRDSLESVAQLMRQRQVRRVPIVDEGRLVGVVSVADMIRHLEGAGSSAVLGVELARTLSAISRPRPEASRAAAE